MTGDMEKQFGRWDGLTMHINDGLAGGPLIIFNPVTKDTLIISQMSQFMVGSMKHNQFFGGTLSYGIMGGVDEIPSNFSIDFLVYYSNNGINKVKLIELTKNFDFLMIYLSREWKNGELFY